MTPSYPTYCEYTLYVAHRVAHVPIEKSALLHNSYLDEDKQCPFSEGHWNLL